MIEIVGLVTSIYRLPSSGRQSHVYVMITDEKLEKHEVMLPHPTETDLDLIPLQLALQGNQVKYTAESAACEPPSFRRLIHTITVKTGRVKGKSYQQCE